MNKRNEKAVNLSNLYEVVFSTTVDSEMFGPVGSCGCPHQYSQSPRFVIAKDVPTAVLRTMDRLNELYGENNYKINSIVQADRNKLALL